MARTVAAGPRDLLKEDPRIDWTVDNVLGVRNWGERLRKKVQPSPQIMITRTDMHRKITAFELAVSVCGRSFVDNTHPLV